jgi:hypothetical protein
MKPIRWTILLLLLLTTAASAALVTGRHTSCAAAWDTGTAAVSGTHLDCTDGDPLCDIDGAMNKSCRIAINVCVDTPTASCTPQPLTKLTFTPGTKRKLVGFVPPIVGGQNCGTAGSAIVTVRSKKHGKVLKPSRAARLLMRGKPGHFKSTLLVRCIPNPGGTTTTTIPTNCPPGQKELVLTVPLEDRAHPELGNGSDLDNGWTGTSHNFPVIGGSSLHYCLTGCDGTTTFACQGSGSTGPGTANGPTFGAPLPLLAANVPVCVVNEFVDPTLTGTYNLQTGDAGSAASPNLVHLTSQVYLRTTFTGEVCPKCQGPNVHGINDTGTCSSTATNAGANCTVNGEITVAGKGLYELSSDCTPQGDSPPTALDIKLPFTTGEATPIVGPVPCPDSDGPQTQDDSCGAGSCTATCTGAACVATDPAGNCIDAKGGISQLCCSNNTATPCFPTKGGGSITRTGHPGTPGNTLVSAALFCVPRTTSTLINITTGLPGPGSLLLPSQVSVRP